MSEPTMILEVGQVWHRIGGKERVRIERVWSRCACDSPRHGPVCPEPAIALRCKRLHGGADWWTFEDDFRWRFEQEPA